MNYPELHANQKLVNMSSVMKQTFWLAVAMCRQIRAAHRPGSRCCLEIYLTYDVRPFPAYLVREWFDDDSGSGDILYLVGSGLVVYA